jgi:nicotinamide phosphoribosyltransferase
MQKLAINPILATDSYKLSHWQQYPPDTRHVYSYLTARGGFWDKSLFFGLQYTLKSYFTGKVVTADDIHEAQAFSEAHFGGDDVFNTKGWFRLLEKHNGKLPLKIRAVPEGSVVPIKNALVTIENTDEEFPWLTNWAETLLLRGTWYPTTVATLSWHIKQVIAEDLYKTGTLSLLSGKLHDFGPRGVSSQESAAIGGAAHLVNFTGSDNMEAILLLQQYYDAIEMPGFSIPAMEHSTVTSWEECYEKNAYQNMISKFPNETIACVIDSYDTHNAVENIFGGELHDKILRRANTVVLRPDSGNPVAVLSDVFKTAALKFGYKINAKGYKVLPQQIRVLQGDGVNYQNILHINSELINDGWSMDNWSYGMGGALLQGQTRDTMQFAIKCSAIDRDGIWHKVFKKPKTDMNKASMGGRFCTVNNGNGFRTVESEDDECFCNFLHTVFLDGELKQEFTLDDVRKTATLYDKVF